MMMLDDAAKKAIADYILDRHDPDRLQLAIALHDAFDTTRMRVITDFSEQISQFLSAALPEAQDWSVNAARLLEKPQERYTGLSVRRATWHNGLYVCIEAETFGPSSWIIGVCGEKGYEPPNNIKKLLDDRFGNGRTTPQWPWFHYFSDNAEFGHWEFGDWRAGAAVIAMRDGMSGDYGRGLCERIVGIAKEVDSLFQL
jgi:hypothetical protein